MTNLPAFCTYYIAQITVLGFRANYSSLISHFQIHLIKNFKFQTNMFRMYSLNTQRAGKQLYVVNTKEKGRGK